MRVLLVAVVVVFAACSKKSNPEVVDAGPPAPPPPPAEKTLLNSTSTLSLFEPADGKCVWRQEDPVAKKRVELASFPGTCVGVRVAWSADLTKAVVWFDPQLIQVTGYMSETSTPPKFVDEETDQSAKPRWFFVDVKSGKTEALTPPTMDKHELRDLGLSKAGDVVALYEETLPDDAKGTIKSGEQSFNLDEITEGLPILAHAYKRDGAKWTRFETKLSTTGWDYAAGVRALDVAGELGPKSDAFLDSHAETDAVDEPTGKQLKQFAPAKAASEDDGEWTALKVGEAQVYVWQVTGEFAHTTGLMATKDAKLPNLDFTDGELVAIRSNGPLLLVSRSDVGTHPRLYKFPEGTRVFASDTARGVTFWPSTK